GPGSPLSPLHAATITIASPSTSLPATSRFTCAPFGLGGHRLPAATGGQPASPATAVDLASGHGPAAVAAPWGLQHPATRRLVSAAPRHRSAGERLPAQLPRPHHTVAAGRDRRAVRGPHRGRGEAGRGGVPDR